ncbi:hypothetical protein ACUOFU_09670 [Microbacterium arabinogalactanolyticum]|uniref:hypothetical protein n=1 Tax=Microbacterium arabinogalactanolyticum TaxID=69365 RepID=UPI004044FC98
MPADASHRELAERLRSQARSDGAGAPGANAGAVDAGAGMPNDLAEPFRTLAEQVGRASFRVTDAQVDAVRDAAGSEQAAFEIVMAASVGAGLRRWDAAMRAIEEAGDAAR